MNVLVNLEQRYDRTPDGRVWSQGKFGYSFWKRYLDVFDTVTVMARVRPVISVPSGRLVASGEGVRFIEVPYYVGPREYIQRRCAFGQAFEAALTSTGAVIVRAGSGSPVAHRLITALVSHRRPYALEVVGDPLDVYSKGAVHHPIRPFMRWLAPRQLRMQCTNAAAVAYVTESTLQRRYPPRHGAFTTHYSSVDLSSEAFVAFPRTWARTDAPKRLVAVGSLANMNKGFDVLIRAVRLLAGRRVPLDLAIMGDGVHRTDLERLTAREGLSDQVRFLGQIPPGDPVLSELDKADLFVMPSRQEGLPRAMIEAMARSLPCIGSRIGGIPELLPEEDMVPVNDAEALAQKILEVLSDPGRMNRMAARNLVKAREYADDVLQARRVAFYQYVRDITAQWLRRATSSTNTVQTVRA